MILRDLTFPIKNEVKNLNILIIGQNLKFSKFECCLLVFCFLRNALCLKYVKYYILSFNSSKQSTIGEIFCYNLHQNIVLYFSGDKCHDFSSYSNSICSLTKSEAHKDSTNSKSFLVFYSLFTQYVEYYSYKL